MPAKPSEDAGTFLTPAVPPLSLPAPPSPSPTLVAVPSTSFSSRSSSLLLPNEQYLMAEQQQATSRRSDANVYELATSVGVTDPVDVTDSDQV